MWMIYSSHLDRKAILINRRLTALRIVLIWDAPIFDIYFQKDICCPEWIRVYIVFTYLNQCSVNPCIRLGWVWLTQV